MNGQELPIGAAAPPRRRADELMATIAERLGAYFSATTVFGTPVERGEVTVIPVAAVRLGFGAGAGAETGKSDGEGGGGGGAMTALGHIELRHGRSRFVPVVRPARMLALVLLALVAVSATQRPGSKPRRLWR
jgi:uncharacterized spore protein YtfJ